MSPLSEDGLILLWGSREIKIKRGKDESKIYSTGGIGNV